MEKQSKLYLIGRIFGQLFAGSPKVDFNPAWANGTGYFDGAYTATLPHGIQHCVDDHGRKLLLMKVPYLGGEEGVVVWNERYVAPFSMLVCNSDDSVGGEAYEICRRLSGAGPWAAPERLNDMLFAAQELEKRFAMSMIQPSSVTKDEEVNL